MTPEEQAAEMANEYFTPTSQAHESLAGEFAVLLQRIAELEIRVRNLNKIADYEPLRAAPLIRMIAGECPVCHSDRLKDGCPTCLAKENRDLRDGQVIESFATYELVKHTEKGGHVDYFLMVMHDGKRHDFLGTYAEVISRAAALLKKKGEKS